MKAYESPSRLPSYSVLSDFLSDLPSSSLSSSSLSSSLSSSGAPFVLPEGLKVEGGEEGNDMYDEYYAGK